MQPVRPVDPQQPRSAARVFPQRPGPATAPPAPTARPDVSDIDRVELSAAAQQEQVTEPRPVAESRLDEVRAQIAAGTYLTPDKIDYVVERLYEELRRQ
jgi:anti-sigma28 factor (negative regulator of flagellin synthesis)